MFKFLKNWVTKIQTELGKAFDEKIEAFNDPMAKDIEWHSIARFSFFYQNRHLARNKAGNLTFYPTIQAILFPGLFMVMGCYVIYGFTLSGFGAINVMLHPIHTMQHLFQVLMNAGFSDPLWGFLFGFVFFVLGAITIIFAVKPIDFDLTSRQFKKGFPWKTHLVFFDDIHAIQLISDAGNDAESHINYELNLVLKSTERVNVLSHGKKKAIVRDAKKLAACLAVPVWDMS